MKILWRNFEKICGEILKKFFKTSLLTLPFAFWYYSYTAHGAVLGGCRAFKLQKQFISPLDKF